VVEEIAQTSGVAKVDTCPGAAYSSGKSGINSPTIPFYGPPGVGEVLLVGGVRWTFTTRGPAVTPNKTVGVCTL